MIFGYGFLALINLITITICMVIIVHDKNEEKTMASMTEIEKLNHDIEKLVQNYDPLQGALSQIRKYEISLIRTDEYGSSWMA